MYLDKAASKGVKYLPTKVLWLCRSTLFFLKHRFDFTKGLSFQKKRTVSSRIYKKNLFHKYLLTFLNKCDMITLKALIKKDLCETT